MSRVLLIGLDSADADLIEQWCDEGRLPTLAQLRADGVWGRLRTTAEVMHVSAWPSIYTGTTPGHHGMYHAYQTRAGEQTALRTRPEWCARPPFWKFLDDAGRKSIVMDAFMNHPLESFRGIQVLEYGTWTWFGEPGASPPGIRNEILRRFGAYPAPEHSWSSTSRRSAGFAIACAPAPRSRRGGELAARGASLGHGVRDLRRAARRRALSLAHRRRFLPLAPGQGPRPGSGTRCETSTRPSIGRSATFSSGSTTR